MSVVTDNFDEAELDWSNDMEFSRLKEEEKVAVASGLANNTRIRILKLVKLALRDSFAEALAKSLETNKTLEVICLDSNSITGPGVMALAVALKVNTTVKDLKLQSQTGSLSTEAEEVIG